MQSEQSRLIQPVERVDAAITVPPSKSYTNRAMITAALARGKSILHGPSVSDDSEYLKKALTSFGVVVRRIGDD
jgi:3-phosphoshikimate 1-carboxyvinyltransferase